MSELNDVLNQIAEEQERSNVIETIEFRSKFAGGAKQQYMEALDSMIDKYISKNMDTDTKSSMHWGGYKM